MSATRIHSIGHSTRTTDDLIALLRENAVTLLADVRSFPGSRRHPQFNIETLPPSLEKAGIAYRHIPTLGGRRKETLKAAESPNAGWRERGFRTYADYALTPPFRDGLATLLETAATRPTAMMCAEALWWQCHRRIITDYLIARGVIVLHILGPGQTQAGSLTPGAEIGDDGTIRYPPAQRSLL